MAIEYGFTGFESGDYDPFISGSGGRGLVLGAGLYRPRTGQNYFNYNPADNAVNIWAAYRRLNTALGVGTPSATGYVRAFIRLITLPGISGGAILCCGTLSSGGQQGNIALNTDGRWKVWSLNAFSAASTDPLTQGIWYRADLIHVITQSGPNVTTQTTGSIYLEDGTLVQTLVATNTGTPLGTVSLPTDSACGNGSAQSTSVEIHFDDMWWGQADGADQATLAFPTATRVSRVFASGAGSVAQWTGDYRTIIDAPMEVGSTDIQTDAVAGHQSLFVKDSAASYGISGIEGVVIAAQLRSTVSAGNESLMLGGVAYPVAVTTSLLQQFPRRWAINYPAAIDNATFDGWEFGARNDRGTSLQMGTCYLEVLHSGTGMPAPYTDVSGPFQINMITYVGNGGYQSINTMGFGAQWIWVCNASNTALASSCMRLARSGGTRMLAMGAGAQETRNGILAITDSGFNLGPNNNVNQNGITYLAIGMRDGGAGVGGFHLSTIGGRPGNTQDNWDVVFPETLTPDIGWNQNSTAGGGGSNIKTSVMPASDFSVNWTGNLGGLNTNFIQAFNANGYQIGNAAGINSQAAYNLGTILKLGSAATSLIHIGTATPSGSTFTVTGLPFTPVWVMCQRQNNTGVGFWRSSLTHATAQSTGWNGGNLQNNGITAITADGFSIGSTLSNAGVPIYWIALGIGSIPQGGCRVTISSGVDGGGIPGCRDSFGNGVDSGGIAGCRVSLGS